jgi:tripartite-type tricarboxylate transporter receptor subunit TctC
VRTIRRLAMAAALGLAPLTVSNAAIAQDYPSQDILFITPSSAGSGFDVVARLITPKMSEILGKPVIVENIAGAGATVGAAKAAEADADGHTILLISFNHAAAEALYKSLSYHLLEDFDPVIRFTSSYHVVVVKKDLEVATLADLIAKAKASPGELNYASAGVGSVTFMTGELFKSAAEIDMTHIPYEGGGPAMASVVAGETDVYVAPIDTAKPFIESGEVKALAVTSKEPLAALPDVPPAAETMNGFEFVNFYGLAVPKGTPPEVIEKIRAATTEAVADPKVGKQLSDLGFVLVEPGPGRLRRLPRGEDRRSQGRGREGRHRAEVGDRQRGGWARHKRAHSSTALHGAGRAHQQRHRVDRKRALERLAEQLQEARLRPVGEFFAFRRTGV